ncbi:hypothetical protein [Pyrobaculum ferrireducens]|uniref:Uncharacterized protein n=1 Tax=Pyrobaculum ferrireducens TaxID=1104324 RepID=G7VFX0_9CREN|nr:hypothetical protein [Pyrobaculum ferrireducens]AET31777.1 hypothetical protein P186_0322 [Pyrobaculum ferrireducens]
MASEQLSQRLHVHALKNAAGALRVPIRPHGRSHILEAGRVERRSGAFMRSF